MCVLTHGSMPWLEAILLSADLPIFRYDMMQRTLQPVALHLHLLGDVVLSRSRSLSADILHFTLHKLRGLVIARTNREESTASHRFAYDNPPHIISPLSYHCSRSLSAKSAVR